MSEAGRRWWRLGRSAATGMRARLYFALFFTSLVMLPVIALSLFYDRGMVQALGKLHDEVTQGVVVTQQIGERLGSEARPQAIEEDLDAHLKAIDAARENALVLVARAERNVVTVLLITLVALVLVFLALPSQVMTPLRRILNVVRRAAHGDYATELRFTGEDEIGQIARELNRLLQRLELERTEQRTLLREVRRDLDLLGRGVDEAICIVDEGLVITYANRAFEALVGADGDLSARRLAEWIPDEALLGKVRLALEGGSLDEVVRFEDHRHESHRHKLYTAAVHAPDGHVDRVAVVLRKAGLLG